MAQEKKPPAKIREFVTNLWDRFGLSYLRYFGALLIMLVGASLITVTSQKTISLEIEPQDNFALRFLKEKLETMRNNEDRFYDFRSQQIYRHGKVDEDFVLLAIDDASLKKVGRWPWSRRKMAEVVHSLKDLGVTVAGFDILWAEPDDRDPEGDILLGKALESFISENQKVIVAAYLTSRSDEALRPKPIELMFSTVTESPSLKEEFAAHGVQPVPDTRLHPIGRDSFFRASEFPIKPVLDSGATLGYISVSPDSDNSFRHFKLITSISPDDPKNPYDANDPAGTYASFATQLYMQYVLATAPQTVDIGKVNMAQAVSQFNFGLRKDGYVLGVKYPQQKEVRFFPMNREGKIKVRYFGNSAAFKTMSLHKVLSKDPLEREELRKVLRGKVVVVGPTAIGLGDLRNTPVDSLLEGPYMHANIFHMLKNDYYFKEENESRFATLVILLLGTLLICAGFRYQSPLLDFVLVSVAIAGPYILDRVDLLEQGYYLHLVSCFLTFISIYVWFTVLNVYREQKEKLKVRSTFSRYVAPSVVKQMLANPEKLKVGGEKKEITMLFSDVRDFTSISEKLAPQDLSALLNTYMTRMTDILFETQGTLDKYIGDALVGFWGAPVDVKDHAYHAVRAAVQMADALPEVNAEFQKKNFPEISIGIGLNTGEVSVGNMGSEKIFQYTAIGDSMNLASRLEGLTKYYGVQVMISEYTRERLGEKLKEFGLRPLDMVQVKGKTQPVKIFEVLPTAHPFRKEAAALQEYEKAYDLYLSRDFPAAKAAFASLTQRFPGDKPSRKMLDTCEEFERSPPPANWTGVSIFTTK